MLSFCIVNMGNLTFRCVLGEDVYFDFRICQLDLFGYDHFFTYMKQGIGYNIHDVKTDDIIGDVASIRYLKSKDEIWVLVRNGIRGELYSKYLGG
jgi:hypothetical protein